MPRLRCKICEKLFELNGETDINCPHCGKFLKNSFTEWKKKPGHENRTFDDYKRKKCYPSSHRDSTHSEFNTTNYDKKYKQLYEASESKKRIQRNVYIWGTVVVVVLVALFTNPQIEKHQKAFHEKIYGKSEISVPTTIVGRDDVRDSSIKKASVLLSIENGVTVTDCILFSVTNVSWSNKTYPIGFGFMGFVLITGEVDRLKRFK